MERSTYKCLVWLWVHWDRQKLWSPLRFKSPRETSGTCSLTYGRAVETFLWSEAHQGNLLLRSWHVGCLLLVRWKSYDYYSPDWLRPNFVCEFYRQLLLSTGQKPSAVILGGRNLDSFSIILTPELLILGSLSKVLQLMHSAMPEASPVCYELKLSGACISFCFFVILKEATSIVFHSWGTGIVYGYKSRQLPWSLE